MVHFLGKLRLIGQMHVLVLKRMGSNPNLLKRPIIMPPPEPIQILLSSMSRFMHLGTWPITNAFSVYLKICYILQIRHRTFYRENLALKLFLHDRESVSFRPHRQSINGNTYLILNKMDSGGGSIPLHFSSLEQAFLIDCSSFVHSWKSSKEKP